MTDDMQCSPCHDCSIHQAGEDKNGPQCLKCDKRLAYVTALEGSRSGPVPMEMTDMAGKWQQSEDQFLRDNPQMHIDQQAKHLGRTSKSISLRRWKLKIPPQPEGLSPDGFPSILRQGEAVVEKETAPAESTDSIINLEDHPDVLDQLRKRAAAELRTVKNQALWFIKCALAGGA